MVNFSKKNIFYIDDNISEIKQLNKFLVKENCLWVKNSYIFFLYSKSIFISNVNKEKNTKRFADIKGNIQRSEVADTSGILNYIKTSNVKVGCSIKKIDFKRFVEMSNKTNPYEGVENTKDMSKKSFAIYCKSKLNSVNKHIKFLKKHINKKNYQGKIFEIGSGNGKLLFRLEKEKLLSEGIGCEISKSRCRFSNKFNDFCRVGL